MPQGGDTLEKLREDVLRLQAELSEIREKLSHKKGHWLKNWSHLLNVLTLIALVLGSLFQVWLNRPVVDMSMGRASPDVFQVSPPFNPPGHEFYVLMQNTGETDITLNVTVGAENATVSTNGMNFSATATLTVFLQARSSWGENSFYVRVNEGVTRFKVYLERPQLVDSPDPLTTQVDKFATYNLVGSQELMWIQTGTNPLAYGPLP